MVILAHENRDGSTSVLHVDASPEQTHGITADITKHQTEGPDVTDHIRPLPRTLTIKGVITNTPISTPKDDYMRGARGTVQKKTVTVNGKDVSYQALAFDQEFDRVRDVFGDFVNLVLAGTLFTVTTSLDTYEDMAISAFTVPVDAASGNALNFTMSFEQITIVSTETVDPLPSQKQKKKHRGAKPTKEPEPTKKEQLRSTIQSLRGSTATGPGAG